MKSILIIDDEIEMINLISSFLKEKYEISSINSGDGILDIFKKNKFNVVIIDVNLKTSKYTGLQVLKEIKKIYPSCQVIIITGLSDSKIIQEALRYGATDYLHKPFDRLSLQHSVNLCIDRYNLIEENFDYQRKLKKKIKEKTNDYMIANDQLNNIILKIVESLTKVVELRDPYTAGHQRKVTSIALKISKKMKFTKKQQKNIFLVGNLHDIGKIYIPQEYLTRPTTLSENEYALIKEHSEKGYEILSDIPFDDNIPEMVRQHHERMDGSGYPRGIKGNNILIESRIISIADTIEAMSSDRPYRKSQGIEKAIEIISDGKGTIFWDKAVNVTLNLLKEYDNKIEDILND